MCGITGIFNTVPNKKYLIDEMIQSLYNRGPDSRGFYTDSKFIAGMRRLSINDISGGDQPLYDESQRIVCFYNGEIYNYKSLRKKLESNGIRFRTNSDGEVICHLFRIMSVNGFEELEGMFAIALYDRLTHKLYLMRDYSGEKPLYYGYGKIDKELVYGSTIDSIVKSNLFEINLDYQSIWDYTTFLWVPEPNTIYTDIKSLMPGELLIFDESGELKSTLINQKTNYSFQINDFNSAVRETKEIVTNTVKSRLLSDVPIGSFLSSGLDSSIIVSIAKKELETLETFCIGFDDISDPYHGKANESIYAEQFAKSIGTKHHTIKVSADDLKSLVPIFLKSAGQPFAVSSGLGVLAVSKFAKENGLKVLLTGDGADESFGGYSWYPDLTIEHGNEKLEDRDRYIDLKLQEKDIFQYMKKIPNYVKAVLWHYYTQENEKKLLFNKDFYQSDSVRYFENEIFSMPKDFIKNDLNFYFTNEMLTKADRMTMAFSVEGRPPFAAPIIKQLSNHLKYEWMINGNTLKYILRKAFENDLPMDIINRPKHGFNIPIDHWLKNEWKEMFEETFSENSILRKKNILSKKSFDVAEKMLYSKEQINGHVLFTIIMLNYWMESNVN